MNCPYCSHPLDDLTSTCPNCGSKVEELPKDAHILTPVNKRGLNLGIAALILSGISYFIFGFLAFVAFGLSIAGLQMARGEAKQGQAVVGSLTLNIVALVISALLSLMMLLYYISLF